LPFAVEKQRDKKCFKLAVQGSLPAKIIKVGDWTVAQNWCCCGRKGAEFTGHREGVSRIGFRERRGGASFGKQVVHNG